MHIIRAFTHLQVRKIPEKYILKRYTRNAREEVPWDRHDAVRIGAEASKEQTRLSKLLPMLMKLGKAGSKSDRAYDETLRLLKQIIPGVEMFQRRNDDESTEPAASTNVHAQATDVSGNSPTTFDPSSTVLDEDRLLIEPQKSRTKGRKTVAQQKSIVGLESNGNPLSTYNKENYGNRECFICKVKGTHYQTTCPLNPNRSKAAEVRKNKKKAITQDGPPRKRGRPRTVKDTDEDIDLTQDGDVDVTQEQLDATQESSGAHMESADIMGICTRSNRSTRARNVSYKE